METEPQDIMEEPTSPTGEEPTPAEAAPESIEAEPTATPPETAPEPDDAERKQAKLDARFGEITREKHDLRRERDALHAILDRILPVQATPPQGATPETFPDLPKPREDDFDDYGDYAEAVGRWGAKVEIRQAEAQRQSETQRTQAQRANEEFNAWTDGGREKFSDFDDVALVEPADGGPQITNEMAWAIKEEGNSHEIAYHLGQNLKEATRISRLTPVGQIREIGKLAYKLANQPPKPKTKTSAPASNAPVAGKDTLPEKLTDKSVDELVAYWDKKEYGRHT